MSGENSPTWKGGYEDYRGPNWKRQRKLALERDGFCCQKCGAIEPLQVHHIRPYQTFDNYLEANELNNLVTLCKTCHTLADWEYRYAHPEELRFVPEFERIHVCVECGKEYNAGLHGHRSKRCPQCMTRTCPKCGKQFRRPAGVHTKKYCSRKCAGTSMPTPSRPKKN
jgi:hypothetical protein